MKKCPKCASSSRQRAKRVGVSKYIYMALGHIIVKSAKLGIFKFHHSIIVFIFKLG